MVFLVFRNFFESRIGIRLSFPTTKDLPDESIFQMAMPGNLIYLSKVVINPCRRSGIGNRGCPDGKTEGSQALGSPWMMENLPSVGVLYSRSRPSVGVLYSRPFSDMRQTWIHLRHIQLMRGKMKIIDGDGSSCGRGNLAGRGHLVCPHDVDPPQTRPSRPR